MLGATRRIVGFIPRRLRPVRQVHGDGDGEERFHFHKSKGQHILINPRILDTIVRKSAINPTDTVLEIGPGTGNLTIKLLEAAQKVVAFEIDHRMVQVLEKRALQHGLRDKLRVSVELLNHISYLTPHTSHLTPHLFDEMPEPKSMKLGKKVSHLGFGFAGYRKRCNESPVPAV